MAPAIVAFALVAWLFLTGRESITDALSFLGVLSLAIMAAIFPMLMVYAGRRMGDYPVEQAWRFVGHPVVVAAICVLELVAVLGHGLVIWNGAAPWIPANATGVGTALLIALFVRRGRFRSRAAVELRLDDRGRATAFQVTTNGEPLPADASFSQGGGDQGVQAAAAKLAAPSVLLSAGFRLPVTVARQLNVWAHQIAPDGFSNDVPALLDVGGELGEEEFDLGRGAGAAASGRPSTPPHDFPSAPAVAEPPGNVMNVAVAPVTPRLTTGPVLMVGRRFESDEADRPIDQGSGHLIVGYNTKMSIVVCHGIKEDLFTSTNGTVSNRTLRRWPVVAWVPEAVREQGRTRLARTRMTCCDAWRCSTSPIRDVGTAAGITAY